MVVDCRNFIINREKYSKWMLSYDHGPFFSCRSTFFLHAVLSNPFMKRALFYIYHVLPGEQVGTGASHFPSARHLAESLPLML